MKYMTLSDEKKLTNGLVFIANPSSDLADTAAPSGGFRPCIPRVPPDLDNERLAITSKPT